MPFEFRDHTADVAVTAWGDTLEEAYGASALALFESIADRSSIDTKNWVEISIQSEDLEALLFDFLSEILAIIDIKDMIFRDAEIEYIKQFENDFSIKARIGGEIVDDSKHVMHVSVKAVSYWDMFIDVDKNYIEFLLDV